MQLSEFEFELPKNLIAKHPIYPRGNSKLLYLNENAEIFDYKFPEIINLFKKGDLLIFNNSKVIPAYLIGKISNSLNILKEVVVYLNRETTTDEWIAFAKPKKLLSLNKEIIFANNLIGKVVKILNSGEIVLKFNYNNPILLNKICNIGMMPIPPYLKRKPEKADNQDYQTVFAKEYGSVAAPTAGLHFTNNLLDKIKNIGVKINFIRLDVGSGTFLPVKSENILEHNMHSEKFFISQETAEAINKTKRDGNRVICVGTTTLRAIESSSDNNGLIQYQNSETNIFITPGYQFKVVDCLITNFHTPKSTLLMLISAFCGINNIKLAYTHAIKNNYRFFSYGDACWLDKIKNNRTTNS